MKERIREIAGELIAVAAERALRPGEVAEPDAQGYATFADRFPFAETDDQDRALADVLADLGAGRDRKSVVQGTSVSARVALGGRSSIKKKHQEDPNVQY